MDHLPINSRSTTENTLAQEQQRRCIAGVTYRALFSSTAHGVMQVEYFVRLILTNLYWISTMRGHTMLPLSCVDTQCYP